MPKRMHPVLGEIDSDTGPTVLAGEGTSADQITKSIAGQLIETEPETEIIHSPNPPPAPRLPVHARAKRRVRNTLIKIAQKIISKLEDD